MRVETAKLAKGLKDASHKVFEFATSLKGLALEGVGGYGMYKLIDIAGEAERTLNRVRFTFGEFGATVTEQSDKMALAFGFSRDEFNKSAVSLGGLLKSEGYSEHAAATLSTAFVTVAEKAARMKGVGLDEYLQKIGKAIAGKSKGLEEIGIVIGKDAIAAKALSLGLMHAGEAISDNAKQQATTALVYEQLQKKTEHYGETVGTTADLMAAFKGRVENLVESFATMLMPMIGPGGAIQEGFAVLQTLMDSWGASAMAASKNVVTGVEGQAASISYLQKSIAYIADTWDTVRLSFLWTQTKITEGLIYMIKEFGGFAEGIGKIVNYFTGLNVSAADFTKTWIEDMNRMKEAQQETFNKLASQAPSSDGINAYFANVRDKMKATSADLAKPIDIAKALADKKAIEPIGKDLKKNKASEFFSSESANTQLRSRYGSGQSNKENAKIARNTEQAAATLKEIAKNTAASSGWGGLEVIPI